MTGRSLLPLILIPAIAFLAGCGSKKTPIAFDPSFSYNLIEVPKSWPDEEHDWPEDPDLALRQQQVYEKHGQPDFFRVRWRRNGDIVSQGDLRQMMHGSKQRKAGDFFEDEDPPMDWIYLDEGIIYEFPNSGVEKEELTDKLRTVAENGDPHEVKQMEDAAGQQRAVFQYYDTGKIYYFVKGEKVEEDTLQAMPGMSMRK